MVPRRTKDDSLIDRHAFDFVSPFPGDFDGRLASFGACSGRQDSLVAKSLCDKFGEHGVHVVVEGSGGQSESLQLVDHCGDELGVTVAMVQCRRGGVEVEVAFTLGIPYLCAQSPGEDDWEGKVVEG
jgi:hypothetical protein